MKYMNSALEAFIVYTREYMYININIYKYECQLLVLWEVTLPLKVFHIHED